MQNKLTRLSEFKTILSKYRISPASRRILDKANLVLLAAPTSGGRNTIIQELVKTGEYHFIISDTTRQPRVNNGILEQTGVEYWFKSEEEFLEGLRKGEYLEAEIIHGQQVSGISIRELARSQEEGRVAITDIDIGGIQNILALKPDVKAIMVLPPSFKEWQSRLKRRGEIDQEELQRRLRTAHTIFKAVLKDDRFTFVVNDKLAEATALIHQIAIHGEISRSYERRGRRITKELLSATEKALTRSRH